MDLIMMNIIVDDLSCVVVIRVLYFLNFLILHFYLF